MPTPASNSAGDRRALERLAPTKQLTSAYRVKTHLRMLDRDRDAAVKWGKAQFNQPRSGSLMGLREDEFGSLSGA